MSMCYNDLKAYILEKCEFSEVYVFMEKGNYLNHSQFQSLSHLCAKYGGRYVPGPARFHFKDGNSKLLKYLGGALCSTETETTNENQNEEVKMLKIEKATLVNGVRASDITNREFLNLIQEQQAEKNSVSILSAKCLTAAKIKKACNTNIRLLEELLDANQGGEE